MSCREFEIRKLLEDATFFIRNSKEDETFLQKCDKCMNIAQELILEDSRRSFQQFSGELLVMFIEVALLTGTRDEIADQICKYFFQRITQKDQFYCRALLAKSSIEANKVKSEQLKGEENLKKVQLAFGFVKQAIEIASKAENKQKYQFIIYNSSIKTYNIIRNLMKQDWMKSLTEILESVSNLLEETDDFDSNWRCRYLNSLMRALFDGEKKPEALKVLDKLVELTKKKGQCDFQELLFRNRIHYYRDNNGTLANIKKETETGTDTLGFKHLFVVQQIKSGAVPEAQVEKELQSVMMAIAPQSVSDEQSTQAKVSQIDLDRLAECGRMCIKYGLIKFAEGAVQVIDRGNPSLRAQIWTLYTQAEILLKKQSSEIDAKTNMKLNTLQKQMEDLNRRKDALALMERAMIANKKLLDADVIVEGCYLIWNISLPFLKGSTRSLLYRPFTSAAQALESIQSNENQLRIQLCLELAKYEITQDLLSNALKQLKKCLNIDCSLTLKNMGIEEKNRQDMERPFDKYIQFLIKRLDLKTNLYGGGPQTVQDQIILDLENAKSSKDAKMRETILNKTLREIQDYEIQDYKKDPNDDLVEEEIELAKFKHERQNTIDSKQRVLILNEMSKLAYEEMLIDIAFQAATLAVQDEWDTQIDKDLIIAQSESHLVLSKCYVEYLLEENVEIGYKELVFLDQSNEEEMDISKEDKQKYTNYKKAFADHIVKSIKFASQSNQSWQIFNGAIEFWNNYLPVFKQLAFYEMIMEDGITAMQEAFEGMNNCFQTANFSSENVDYELQKKMNIFSNLSVMLARVNEYLGKNDETVRICDLLLQKQLPSHLRKTFDSIKAKVTKSVNTAGGAAAAKGGAKGAKDAPVVEVSKSEQVQAEIVGLIELIKNGQKDNIQKAIECLSAWKPDDQEEIDLELNAELWCKVGRLAIDQNENKFTKMALYCAENCILQADQKAKNKSYDDIPVTRLRWYSVSECLYGESLAKLLDKKKQEKESQDVLLFQSVLHFVESANIASSANIGFLVLENCKCMWNSLIGLLDAPNNRQKLIIPLSKTHDYLKHVKEDSDPDFLSLFYSALFMCINEQKDWKLGEKIVDQAFSYVPSSHHKVLWEAKMNYLSKLGKNVLQAISNMKESNASLMAKVYVKLARSSSQRMEQHSAYNKAIEILRKEESIEVVEVLIEYAEWLQRSNYTTSDIEDNLLLAADILMDIEPGWDEEDDLDDDGDDFERKTKQSKSSKFSKGSKAKTKVSRAPKSTQKTIKGPKSRVSNASKRKSIKSKHSAQTKKTNSSLKIRQEEDGHPQFLNVQHYEKLVRIYSMLTLIAHDSTKQQEYVLDAHFFIMKMFEQSFQVLNAVIFFEQHQQVMQQQGYNADNIKEYLQELMMSGDFSIPLKHSLPEQLDQWVNFEIPTQMLEKSRQHEDNMMISKLTFNKPELTLFHLRNVNSVLESYLFSMQQIPVLHLIEIFSQEIIQDSILAQVAFLQRSRLLHNLGIQLEQKSEEERKEYQLTTEEKKYHLEKIKALKDINDDMKNELKNPLAPQDLKGPKVMEVNKIHNSWLELSQEQLKWGKFSEAKELIQEVILHSRILKDQYSFAKALLSFSSVKYIEGEIGTALKLCIRCQQQCQDISLMEQIVTATYTILNKFNKDDDAVHLLEESLIFIDQILQKASQNMNQSSTFNNSKQKSQYSVDGQNVQNNLDLQYFKAKCLILLSQELIKQASNNDISIKEKKRLQQESFDKIDAFMKCQTIYGCNQSHLQELLKYCEFLKQNADHDFEDFAADKIDSAKTKYEKCAQLLIKNQEILNDQLYYIGISNEKQQKDLISLPLQRQLGVTKLRIAQIYTQIGIVKNNIKLASQELLMQSNESTQNLGSSEGNKQTSADKEMQRLNREHATFMDQISKQIEANANTYTKEMNRYEKSIIILESALNLLHQDCTHFQECLIEVAKCKRLLAVNKKHLRGQWRQDAAEIDKINLQKDSTLTHLERREQLMSKQLDGEILDKYLDYKNEAVKAFILLSQASEDNEEEVVDAQAAKKGQVVEEKTDKVSLSKGMLQILSTIGESRIQNLLATYSLEFAECRGNLNKEQAFLSICQYQYAISRQFVLNNYIKNWTQKHPDLQRYKQQMIAQDKFSYFDSPLLPPSINQNSEELKENSKVFKKLNSCIPGNQLFDSLEDAISYLTIQFSDDQQYLFINFVANYKEKSNQYYLTKYHVGKKYKEVLLNNQNKIENILKTLERIKMQTNEESDMIRQDCQKQVDQIIKKLENMFEQIILSLDKIINPEVALDSEETQTKKEDKKDDKAKAAKGKDKGKQLESQPTQNNLNMPLPTSGIQKLVLMVDKQIQLLPFEYLKVFEKIPQVSRDLNLFFQIFNQEEKASYECIKEQEIAPEKIMESIKEYKKYYDAQWIDKV